MAYTEDEIYDMSDDELEAAMSANRAEIDAQVPDEDTQEEPEFEEATDDTEDTSVVEENIDSGEEQPEEDSNHDLSEEEAEEETEKVEPEVEADNPDGDKVDTEDNSKEAEEAKVTEPQPVQKSSFKADGMDYEFTQEEMLEKFPEMFGKAMNFTKKMQAIKPWRKTIDALEGAKLSHDDINLMIDVWKGDKDAMSEILKRTGVDTLDLDTEASNYVANDYGRDSKSLDIKDVLEDIRDDKEYETTYKTISKDWDDPSWKEMSDDPNKIKLLHEDVKSGVFAKLQPAMNKLKLFGDGTKSDLELYGVAAREYAQSVSQNALEADRVVKAQALQEAKVAEIKAQEATREATRVASTKRKAAVATKASASKRTVTNYLDDSDEAYDEFIKRIDAER